MSLLPAKMQNSDFMPLTLGKKIVAPVKAAPPSAFEQFEKGDYDEHGLMKRRRSSFQEQWGIRGVDLAADRDHLVIDKVWGEVSPTMAAGKVPFLINADRGRKDIEPSASVRDAFESVYIREFYKRASLGHATYAERLEFDQFRLKREARYGLKHPSVGFGIVVGG